MPMQQVQHCNKMALSPLSKPLHPMGKLVQQVATSCNIATSRPLLPSSVVSASGPASLEGPEVTPMGLSALHETSDSRERGLALLTSQPLNPLFFQISLLSDGREEERRRRLLQLLQLLLTLQQSLSRLPRPIQRQLLQCCSQKVPSHSRACFPCLRLVPTRYCRARGPMGDVSRRTPTGPGRVLRPARACAVHVFRAYAPIM
jgi:hypothetical protein